MEMQLKQDQAVARPRLCRPRPQRELGRAGTRPVCDPGVLWWTHILLWVFFFFFFLSFFSDEHIFCCNGFLLLLSPICLWLILVVNRVLETRFSCRCHMEKVPHQTWITHKNRVPKTRFIDPKSSLLDSNC